MTDRHDRKKIDDYRRRHADPDQPSLTRYEARLQRRGRAIAAQRAADAAEERLTHSQAVALVLFARLGIEDWAAATDEQVAWAGRWIAGNVPADEGRGYALFDAAELRAALAREKAAATEGRSPTNGSPPISM